uniref:G-protein coupled receptors family 1 profile domain-containing protein n=1 Tax=Plectus sambesii TaxID=2011161 RepID=A0A914X9Q1_9BILA
MDKFMVLLLHTCVADLFFAVLSLFSEILVIITYPTFMGPSWLCKLVRYLQMFPMYASPFLLVAISADRFQAICRPMAHYRSDRYRRPNFLASAAWSLALLCSLPQFFVWHKSEDGVCVTVYGREQSLVKTMYVIGFNTVAWLLPSILAACFYSCVCRAVWSSKFHQSSGLYSVDDLRAHTVATSSGFSPILDGSKSKKLKKWESQTVAATGDRKRQQGTTEYIQRLRSLSHGHQRQNTEYDRKRIQTVRLTLTIIVCNFFLWAPFCLTNVLQAVAPTWLSPQIITYIIILGNLNSCVNPWIYVMFNSKQVRRAFCEQPKRKNNSSRRDFDQTTVAFSAVVQCDTLDALDANDKANGNHKKSTVSEVIIPLSDRQGATAADTINSARKVRLLSLHDSILLPDTQEDPIRLCAYYVDEDVTIRRVVPLSKVAGLNSAQKDCTAASTIITNCAPMSR